MIAVKSIQKNTKGKSLPPTGSPPSLADIPIFNKLFYNFSDIFCAYPNCTFLICLIENIFLYSWYHMQLAFFIKDTLALISCQHRYVALPHFDSGHYFVVWVYWTLNIFLQKIMIHSFFHSYQVLKQSKPS